MEILKAANDKEIKRLLELFPIANLRAVWTSVKGNKEELCHEVAAGHEYAQIANFVDENLGCCKQHMYVFSHGGKKPALPDQIADGGQVKKAKDHALYIIRSVNKVVLKDPLEETTLEFLWPIRLDVTDTHLIVKFVVLEKNLGAYFERPYYLGDRGIDEKDVLVDLIASLGLKPTDLHRGVKKLWDDGFMDTWRTKYKKPRSLASEAMDEELGIREHNPELYEVLVESPMYQTLFKISRDKELSVEVFSVDPTRGALAFLRYSDNVGDTDFVVREILKHN